MFNKYAGIVLYYLSMIRKNKNNFYLKNLICVISMLFDQNWNSGHTKLKLTYSVRF